jgi:TonB family protein
MTESATQSGDRLLWLAASVVACMGLAWLVIEAPWSTPAAAVISDSKLTMPVSAVATTVAVAPAQSTQSTISDPLHLARLALEAGMLIEPADYSAWSLFGAAAAADPHNREAHDGLEQVANALLGRSQAALEQGRYDDASAIVETIVSRLPQHEGALALAEQIVVATTPPEPLASPKPEVATELAPAPAPVDPIPALNASFLAAMAANAVLTPPGTSARDIVSEMLATAPEHELTVSARELLVTEMLDRSLQSIEALDTAAAQTWINSATPLADDPRRIARAQDQLMRHLISVESQKLLPAASLTQVKSVAPKYPEVPLSRGIEGWVDVEFVVNPDGETENIQVIDASHDRYFRAEAVGAVEQWRFKPVIFMNQAIPQRAYARLAFVLN